MQLNPKYTEYEKGIHSEEIMSYQKSSSLFYSHTENTEGSKIRLWEVKTKNHGKCVSCFMYLTNPLVLSYTMHPHQR